MPNLYIIAGANGSGKTTFAKEYLPHYAKCNNFINADLIALGLSPFDPANVRIKAGRLLLEQINIFTEAKTDFAIETTLAGKTYLNLLKRIKDRGYLIHIFFLWAPDIKLVKARIKQRVKEGGHDVPPKDITRRFHRSYSNFFKFYKPLCDSWMIFDNSRPVPRLIAHKTKEGLSVIDQDLFDKIIRGNKK